MSRACVSARATIVCGTVYIISTTNRILVTTAVIGRVTYSTIPNYASLASTTQSLANTPIISIGYGGATTSTSTPNYPSGQ
jgi:hypothetical protein